MRPVRRNTSPQPNDFVDYRDACPTLISRLGIYCSYCERRINAGLAVEHIQPKGLPQYVRLEGRWENFLLACVNCNSTKRTQDVNVADVLLPDRDNTFVAVEYSEDGTVRPARNTSGNIQSMAARTLSLVGLDRLGSQITDENGKLIALDRVSQRMNAWALANEVKKDVDSNPGNASFERQAVRNAMYTGFFSIWMAVFAGNTNIRKQLIDAFPGTRESGCFDPITTQPVVPAPNPDQLPHGGKA